MNSTINTIKLKELLGSIQVRLNSVDDKLNSIEDVKKEVNEIKNSFGKAMELIVFENNDLPNRITRFPKGGKSL